ncbi:MAG: peptidase M42 [Spirochaetes bacterium GWD1_61_31]|nr:MAG: peptidase M42 [Spirochaetes bacterium GWB1_60_80]OHD28832.1 MAG: peptidase M42 [Spirochaetes bacterium GWC1_61_12]OHD42149.1 MAG: peptidase M42 [Spirochaetes bacterium GWD1_61_31]OHD46652.1 MAG: peptidase M42 [Spirochaetes bacterium GWE1_60_18]OHD61528.1 MAG: peptidase M42 [Spirochaetes bacterium GWF1_60_12]HAP44403.1 peptidase M42 [Spirochaetaceae bacterium]
MKQYVDKAVQRIVELCAIPSPSGFTRQAEEYVFSALAALGYTAEYSTKRSVRVKLGGSGAPLLLSAHVDTLGAMVRSIGAKGELRISKIGFFPENYIEQENCLVHSREGKVFSGRFLLDNPAVHVNKDAATAKRDDSTVKVILDEQVTKADEVKALGISAGDFVSFDPRTVVTANGFVKSRHLDDKASAAILLALAEYIRDQKITLKREVWLLFSTYEEVGHGGSSGLPAGLEEFISVDMGAVGDDLSTNEFCVSICAKDSRGPYDYDVTNRLIACAKAAGLKYAVDIYPFYGSDADAALAAGQDVRHGLIGPGVQASHGYERTHREGLENTFKLLAAYLA